MEFIGEPYADNIKSTLMNHDANTHGSTNPTWGTGQSFTWVSQIMLFLLKFVLILRKINRFWVWGGGGVKRRGLWATVPLPFQ